MSKGPCQICRFKLSTLARVMISSKTENETKVPGTTRSSPKDITYNNYNIKKNI